MEESKVKVLTIEECRALEGQIKDGATYSYPNKPSDELTMDDISVLMKELEQRAEKLDELTWVVYTGYGGYMTIVLKASYDKYGRMKLPRKLKKLYYKEEKDRRRYLPQYYKKQTYYKFA